ncbi:MAG: signal peptidase I [Alphaproteobacteria bacterium]
MMQLKAVEKTTWLRLKGFSLDKANLKKGLWGFGIAFISFGIFSEHVHFIKSPTDSLPQRYFVQLPNIKPQKGDLTVVYNGFYKGKIIKRIIGVAGDQISTDGNGNIFINQQKIGRAHEHTNMQSGLTLTTIKPQIIPEGRVFLYSPHPRSFDSRYQEVGLVPVSDLEGKAVAIV